MREDTGSKVNASKGLVIVYTGDGKGKTTAALGMLFRAWGRELNTCVVQFIKAKGGLWGEVKAAQKLGIEWHKVGDGFTWFSKDMEESVAKALFGWQLAQQKREKIQFLVKRRRIRHFVNNLKTCENKRP